MAWNCCSKISGLGLCWGEGPLGGEGLGETLGEPINERTGEDVVERLSEESEECGDGLSEYNSDLRSSLSLGTTEGTWSRYILVAAEATDRTLSRINWVPSGVELAAFESGFLLLEPLVFFFLGRSYYSCWTTYPVVERWFGSRALFAFCWKTWWQWRMLDTMSKIRCVSE